MDETSEYQFPVPQEQLANALRVLRPVPARPSSVTFHSVETIQRAFHSLLEDEQGADFG